MIFRHTSGKKNIYENSELIPTATVMLILTAIIILSMIFANLSLVTLTYASSDPFATEESKPSCAEIERNDDLYFDLGKEDWVKQCRTEKTENLSDIFG